jgi:hypothetical protein
MSVEALERLRREVDQLTNEERRELVRYLLEAGQSTSEAPVDINSLRGTIKLTVDPLEYQRDSRADRF